MLHRLSNFNTFISAKPSKTSFSIYVNAEADFVGYMALKWANERRVGYG
ncbi:MAG: hypothetical protein ACLQO7_07590 [Candidatus Bathyarchaeia archaeon]